MRKIIAHVLCALLLAGLGIFVLVSWPKETLPLVIGVALVVLAIAVALPAPLHEGVIVVDANAPLLTRALGGLVQLGRRKTDPVAVVPPAAPPAEPPAPGAA